MSQIPPNVFLRTAVVRCLLVALFLAGYEASRAAELRATSDFADVVATAEQFVEKYGAEHVLIALDIDNTMMSMDDDLGSDHWFEWQDYLLKNEADSPHLVADTFPGLLKVQDKLYDLGHMHPTQPEQPEMVAKLQKAGVAAILLTSRGPEFRKYTERELKRCGYDFAISALPVPKAPDAKAFLAYDPKDPEKDGLTPAEIATYKMSEPRPVSYADGVFMTAGQPKGMLLLTLLKDSPRNIKAVVYVDDNVRHVGSVFSAAVARGLDVASFHSQHEDKIVKRFNYSDKTAITARWKAIEREMNGEVEPIEPAPKTEVVAKPAPQKRVVYKRARVRRQCCR